MSDSSIVAIGTSVAGYTLVEKLGEGGMGEVFLAQHDKTGTKTAIKFLSLHPHRDQSEQRLRFERETNLMTQLCHPHIAEIRGQGVIGDRPYLLMEYIEGGSLRDRMAPGQPLPAAEVRLLVGGIVEALATLEQAGIIHRDLKPENVLLSVGQAFQPDAGAVRLESLTYIPKITDFGIAVAETEVGQLTRTAEMLGTIDYMAPEQRARLPVDARADQYALAVIVYEMLTGKRPVGHFKPPSLLNRRLHASVDAVLLRALREDPDDRFGNIRDFATLLDAALLLEPRRLLRVAAVGVGVLLIASVALGGVVARQSRTPKTHQAEPAASALRELLEAPLVEPAAPPDRSEEAKYYLDRGDDHLSNGRDREAETCYTEAIRLSPRDPVPYLKRAYVFKKNELYQKALDDLKEALERDASLVTAWTGRGSIYVQLKDYEKSLGELDHAIALNPKSAEALTWRGWARYKLDKKAAAREDLDAAVRYDRDGGIAYQFRAIVYLGDKRYALARQDLLDAVRCMPDNPHAHAKLADLLALCPDKEVRDTKLAVEHATRACELTQWKGWNELRYLAKARAADGDLASAMRWCEKAIDLAPEINRKLLRSQLEGYRKRAGASRKTQP